MRLTKFHVHFSLLSQYSIPIWIPCHFPGMKLDLNVESMIGPLCSHHYFHHSPSPTPPQQLFCLQWFTQVFLIDNTQACTSAKNQSSLKIQLLHLLIPTDEISVLMPDKPVSELVMLFKEPTVSATQFIPHNCPYMSISQSPFQMMRFVAENILIMKKPQHPAWFPP